jgi:hypothetical protein
MKKYKLTVGYGDYYWDLGYDEFYADTIEELYDEIYTNPIPIERIKEELNKYDYMEDEADGMWRIEVIVN